MGIIKTKMCQLYYYLVAYTYLVANSCLVANSFYLVANSCLVANSFYLVANSCLVANSFYLVANSFYLVANLITYLFNYKKMFNFSRFQTYCKKALTLRNNCLIIKAKIDFS